MTNSQRISYIIKFITVEPMLLGYLLASSFCLTALYNLSLEKTCLANLRYNDSVCQAIVNGEGNFTEENDEVEKVITRVQAWVGPLTEVVPIILILFIGPFSDLYKMRKPFLIIPIIGEFFSVTGCMLSAVYMKEWTMEVAQILQSVVPSFTGGPALVEMIVMSYIADVSSVETRTLRVGVVVILLQATVPLAQLVSGVLFRYGGYFGSFCVADCCFLCSLLYTIFCIKEPRKSAITSKKSLILSIFNPKHALETFRLPFKKAPENNRQFIAIVTVILLISNTAYSGEVQLTFLYLKKVFNWTAENYTYFSSINLIIASIGTAFGISVLSKFLKISDLLIAVIGFLDNILFYLIICLAKVSTTLYFASAASALISLAGVPLISFKTKIVSEDDFATAQSLFAVCEAIARTIGSNLFNIIYNKSVEEFASLVWYIMVLLHSVCIPLLLWMYFTSKKEVTEIPENNKPAENYRSTVM